MSADKCAREARSAVWPGRHVEAIISNLRVLRRELVPSKTSMKNAIHFIDASLNIHRQPGKI